MKQLKLLRYFSAITFVKAERIAPFQGRCSGPMIFIAWGSVFDVPLLFHELTHVKQFWAAPFTHMHRYSSDATYRLECEVEAYAVQLKMIPSPKRCALLPLYAEFIATRYNLPIDTNAAIMLLKDAAEGCSE